MPGTKGKITRSRRGQKRTVYLSDVFGLWPEGKSLHVAMAKDKEELHTTLTRQDGLLYEVMLMLYHYGKTR